MARPLVTEVVRRQPVWATDVHRRPDRNPPTDASVRLEAAGQGHHVDRPYPVDSVECRRRPRDAADRDVDRPEGRRRCRVGLVRLAGLPLVRPGRVSVPRLAGTGADPVDLATLGTTDTI